MCGNVKAPLPCEKNSIDQFEKLYWSWRYIEAAETIDNILYDLVVRIRIDAIPLSHTLWNYNELCSYASNRNVVYAMNDMGFWGNRESMKVTLNYFQSIRSFFSVTRMKGSSKKLASYDEMIEKWQREQESLISTQESIKLNGI